jgi:hypothetical protein
VTDLGAFGAALRELDSDERDHFTFFGERFELVADVPAIVEMKLAAGLNGSLPEEDAVAAMWEALQIALDEDREPVEGQPPPLLQFDRFERIAREKRADLPSVMKLVFKICSAPTGRPTARPSAAGGGPPATSPSSSPSPSLQALPGMRPVSDILDGSGRLQAG